MLLLSPGGKTTCECFDGSNNETNACETLIFCNISHNNIHNKYTLTIHRHLRHRIEKSASKWRVSDNIGIWGVFFNFIVPVNVVLLVFIDVFTPKGVFILFLKQTFIQMPTNCAAWRIPLVNVKIKMLQLSL